MAGTQREDEYDSMCPRRASHFDRIGWRTQPIPHRFPLQPLRSTSRSSSSPALLAHSNWRPSQNLPPSSSLPLHNFFPQAYTYAVENGRMHR